MKVRECVGRLSCPMWDHRQEKELPIGGVCRQQVEPNQSNQDR